MDIFLEKSIKPMLIKDMVKPFNNPDWLYELKLDGIRCLAYLDDNSTDLRNKRNMLLLPKFPELKDIHMQVKGKCILDGELIILKNGAPEFFELQRRTLLMDPFKIQLSYMKYPASYVAYDILYLNSSELVDLPLIARKRILNEIVDENACISVSRYVEEKGTELYSLADKQELEGVVAKKKDSKYVYDKRTKDWVKFKRMADEDFVICGFIKQESHSTTIILGKYKNGILIYKGNVSLGVRSKPYNWTIRSSSPFYLNPLTDRDNITWVEPNLVCVVEYMPNSKNTLRQPVFKGVRDDVLPKDVVEF